MVCCLPTFGSRALEFDQFEAAGTATFFSYKLPEPVTCATMIAQTVCAWDPHAYVRWGMSKKAGEWGEF
jgi:hypothetical protein